MSPLRLWRNRGDYERYVTALDIGTDLVKALVVRREAPNGVVLGVGREPQHPAAMRGGAIADVELVIDSCNRALEAAEDMAGTVPGQVVIGIAGEMVKSFSASVVYPRERPEEPVREAELRNMLELVEMRSLREAQHMLDWERPHGEPGEVRVVHSDVTRVRMDGYPMIDPIGSQGRYLEVTVFNTFAPAAQVLAIETVARKLDLDIAGTVSRAYALARACAGEDAWERGGIFIDIGGGTTDVALLRGGVVEGAAMFGLGSRASTLRIAGELRLSYYDAEASKLRHSEGLLPLELGYQLSRLLMADVDILLQGLALCLGELARGEALPADIHICGGGSLVPELMEGLDKGIWAQGLPFEWQPRGHRLSPLDARNLVDQSGQLMSARDLGPMALANHALRVGGEDRDVVSRLMQRVLKAIEARPPTQDASTGYARSRRRLGGAQGRC